MLTYRSLCLAVMNQKGGVGKSTTTELFSEWLAVCIALKVLIVDSDMQANSSQRYIEMKVVPPTEENESGTLPPDLEDFDAEEETHLNVDSNIADIFDDKMCEARPTQFSPDAEDESNRINGLIDIMLAHPVKLELINGRFAHGSPQLLHKVINRLQEVLHMKEYADNYDIIIIDTAPTRTPMFRAAMRAATHLVVPFVPEAKAMQGLLSMVGATRTEQMQRNGDREVELTAMVPNMVRRGTDHISALADLQEEGRYTKYLTPLSERDGVPMFIPLTTDISKRGFKHVKPDSLFKMPVGNEKRQEVERVMLALARRVFKDHPALEQIEAYAAKTPYLHDTEVTA